MASVVLAVDGSSGNAELEQCMAEIFVRVFALWKTKQHDYGPRNIAEMGEVGVATRANDKVQRLMYLDGDKPDNEPVIDSWLDLCDYGAIGAAIHLGYWPKLAPPPFAIKSRSGTAELFINGAKVATIATEVAVKLILGAGDNAALLNALGDNS